MFALRDVYHMIRYIKYQVAVKYYINPLYIIIMQIVNSLAPTNELGVKVTSTLRRR